MVKEYVTDGTGKVTAIITHHEVKGADYGDYVKVPNDATLEQIEKTWETVWQMGKSICEKAGADPIRVQMVVKLTRCEMRKEKECGYPYREVTDDTPIMTVGWKVHLTDEENARLDKETIASIAGGIFAEGE